MPITLESKIKLPSGSTVINELFVPIILKISKLSPSFGSLSLINNPILTGTDCNVVFALKA